VYKLVAELSQGTTLLPGTVILTGTPEGVGMARKPQLFLRDGDVVEVEIERVGRICNRVEFE
jgi:2-keto-4-pentenoate hydratase/2-oxohepta-3-ene-1,7-dioic acid hydratase in catechol pathway